MNGKHFGRMNAQQVSATGSTKSTGQKQEIIKAKPFLKWAGGKGQLLEKFRQLYPSQLIQNQSLVYYEPFVGSGAVFFDVVQNFNIKKAHLFDINEDLIAAYGVIQHDVSQLLELLHRHERAYLKRDKKQRSLYFYHERTRFNNERIKLRVGQFSDWWIARTARLIFLNKTCFNGLYRVNLKGDFNTPTGEYVNPTICDEKNLMAVHHVLQKAEIKLGDFSEVLKTKSDNAFVYFDPPYRPISKTSSFTAYSSNEFTDASQTELCRVFKKLDKHGAAVMLSNSDPRNTNPKDDFFDKLYKDYTIVRVPAKRSINSNGNKRGAINEIVVTNYSISGTLR